MCELSILQSGPLFQALFQPQDLVMCTQDLAEFLVPILFRDVRSANRTNSRRVRVILVSLPNRAVLTYERWHGFGCSRACEVFDGSL